MVTPVTGDTRAWESEIEGYLLYLRAGGAPESTCRTRRDHLTQVAAAMRATSPWAEDAGELLAWFAGLTVAQETRRSRRTSLRSFYRWGVADARTAYDLGEALPLVKASTPNPRPVPDRVYTEALMRADERVRLMLRLGAEMGLRRGEVAHVHSRDLFEDLDGWTLRVHGKGGKERDVPMPAGLERDLRALPWGYAFPGDHAGHLSPRWVGTLVARALPPGWTMHKLRHRFATRAYAVDRDVFTVQELLGHASPATTRAYVKIPRASLRSTVDAVA